MRAAPWISVSRVKIDVAGVIVKTWEVPASAEIQRFHDTLDLVVPNDTYVIARVEGDKPLTPVVGGGKDIEVHPFALGKYDPPVAHGTHGKNATEPEENE